MIFLASVEHSGTRFLLKLFKSAGFIHRYPQEPREDNAVIQDHFGHKHWDKFLPGDHPVVIPLRRLHSIFLSWEVRQKDFAVLDAQLSMMRQVKRPLWLPIDAEDRDVYLGNLNRKLGIHLKTDWCVISDKHTDRTPESAIQNVNEYQNLKAKHGRFFSCFYKDLSRKAQVAAEPGAKQVAAVDRA